jgi:hypothetical protein
VGDEDEEIEKPIKRGRPSREEDPPVRRARAVHEDLEEDDAEAVRRPARRRKKKRRKSLATSSLFESPGLILGGTVVLLVINCALLYFVPALLLPVLGIGGMIGFVGSIWVVIIAFQESIGSGLLCLFIPFYIIFYCLSHFEETKTPFMVWLVGFALMLPANIMVRVRPVSVPVPRGAAASPASSPPPIMALGRISW